MLQEYNIILVSRYLFTKNKIKNVHFLPIRGIKPRFVENLKNKKPEK